MQYDHRIGEQAATLPFLIERLDFFLSIYLYRFDFLRCKSTETHRGKITRMSITLPENDNLTHIKLNRVISVDSRVISLFDRRVILYEFS